MNRGLFAYTATHARPWPEYVNVALNTEGGLVIIVRSQPSPEGYEGNTASIVIPQREAEELLVRLLGSALGESIK